MLLKKANKYVIIIQNVGGVDMVDYEKIISQINVRCVTNNGSSFEIDDIIPKLHWSKKYRGKKFLFSCHWEYVESDGRCEEVERVLRKLPKGIQYKKDTVLTRALPDKAEQYHTAYENYETNFTIVVTEVYLKKFKPNNDTSRFLVSSVFDKNTLKLAQDFEKRISASHPSIIRTLSHSFGSYGILSNNGFDYDGGTSFLSVGMKPLSCEYQRLGLALALVKCDISLKADQFYYIDRYGKKDEFSDKFGAVLIEIKTKGIKEKHLNDW